MGDPRSTIAWLLGVTISCASLLSGCRVGPPVTNDALLAPFRDAATDVQPDKPAGTPCDLLAQDCPDKKTCYPVDGQPGKTSCELTGSAPPSTACVMSLECDALEACVFVPEAQTSLCVALCNPAAAQTGCLPRAVCRPLTGYRAGYCVP